MSENKNDKNIYLGVYDYKESDTFRPTLDKRVHFGSQISKTIATRTDSCTIILGKNNNVREREYSQHQDLEEILNGLSIRRLTETECMALMGFTKEDVENMVKAGISPRSIYRIAGDSIVTTVLMSIFAPLVNEEDDSHKQIVENYVEKIIEKDHL